jgi:hypothetical protein
MRYNQAAIMLCRFTDVIEIMTVNGSTKTVSVVDVVKMVSPEQYSEFLEYVVGHPKEFPQEKFITIEVSG